MKSFQSWTLYGKESSMTPLTNPHGVPATPIDVPYFQFSLVLQSESWVSVVLLYTVKSSLAGKLNSFETVYTQDCSNVYSLSSVAPEIQSILFQQSWAYLSI